jgi:amidase
MAGSGQAQRRVEAALARITRYDDALRAFITVDAEGARFAAGRLDHEVSRGPLHGLPVAIKDLTDTAGLRTTYGSALFAEHVPERDDLIVARLRAAGAVIIGKTMTPEFGFGATCRNPLGGPTANPWQIDLTSGGSSGGAAAAVASGMVPLAQGTDFGGSVRTPAGFCGVLSIRPTPGVLPNPARTLGYDMLSTTGFLARSVAILTRALRATAGPDALDPLSISLPKRPAVLAEGPLRIAVTEDFGIAPVAAAVRARLRAALAAIPPELGALTAATPDCAGIYEMFHTLRPALIRRQFGPLMAQFGARLTDTVRWWIERGAGISAADFLAAEAERTALARRFVWFFDDIDVMIAPAASVMPWPNSIPEVTEIDGQPLATIVDYLAVTFIVTLAGCPVVTLPVPLMGEKLPFGIQLIGPPGSDLRLLGIAARFEKAGFRFVPPPGFG